MFLIQKKSRFILFIHYLFIIDFILTISIVYKFTRFEAESDAFTFKMFSINKGDYYRFFVSFFFFFII